MYPNSSILSLNQAYESKKDIGRTPGVVLFTLLVLRVPLLPTENTLALPLKFHGDCSFAYRLTQLYYTPFTNPVPGLRDNFLWKCKVDNLCCRLYLFSKFILANQVCKFGYNLLYIILVRQVQNEESF